MAGWLAGWLAAMHRHQHHPPPLSTALLEQSLERANALLGPASEAPTWRSERFQCDEDKSIYYERLTATNCGCAFVCNFRDEERRGPFSQLHFRGLEPVRHTNNNRARSLSRHNGKPTLRARRNSSPE